MEEANEKDRDECEKAEEMNECCNHGPGYKTPMDAFLNGPREKYLFVMCPNVDRTKPDMLASVDVDPESPNYCKVISRLDFPHAGDEVHHSGWNACSSCYGDANARRTHLVLPCLNSSRIYIVDTADPCNLKMHKVIEPEVLFKEDCSFPHTSHCLADGNIMISTLGKADNSNKGDFFLLDGKTFEPVGTWPAKDSKKPPFNYDFWYQPRCNLMISTEWGNPKKIKKGFSLLHLAAGHYGRHINVWNWKERKLVQRIKLDIPDGYMPFEIRFLHEPTSTHGFFLSIFGSTLYHFHRPEGEENVVVNKVVAIPRKYVRNWIYPEMPAMVADLVISMDDKYLYFSTWLHGEVYQYDITDPSNAKFVSKVNVGGQLHTESAVTSKTMSDLRNRPPATRIKGKRIEGGAQMLQLSLDGKRLYVNTQLYTIWDFQMQSPMKNGTQMVMIDVDTEKGGMALNKNFLVDWSSLPGGPFMGHEMRYPGGDCTSDIWI